MSEIIASTYEIIEKIGSGGGGNVFLANHIRLGKKVVLKADKRKVTTRPDLLRREVDILKNLNHQYIPQVYDFFIDGETVYTVMDYIEGESLDKPLKRGERFSQSQVILWAVQLLEALCYLHSPTHGDPPKGFVHSDIKPANLMRTPSNNISLIDFNIALALGEENVVGCSAGYASPEHYGLDFSTRSGTDSVGESTETVDDKTSTVTLSEASVNSTDAPYKRRVMPDVRSDIYSVGATLYHLLSGKLPAKDATEVVPLSSNEFSPQVVAIITKAMNPNPDLRFQTADEMLDSILRLRTDDPRVKSLKRNRFIASTFVSLLFLFGLLATFIGLKRMQLTESWLKFSEYSQNALADGDVASAIQYALQAIPVDRNILTPPAIAEAQKALTDALGVYDIADDFKAHGTFKLDGKPLKVAASPDGTYTAALVSQKVMIWDNEFNKQTVAISANVTSLCDIVFVDENIILYADSDALHAYSVSDRRELWTSSCGATKIALSQNGTVVAALNEDGNQIDIFNTAEGSLLNTISPGKAIHSDAFSDVFADPKNDLMCLNDDGTILAVSFSDGGLCLYDMEDPDNTQLLYEESEFTHFEGGFFEHYFVCTASTNGASVLSVVDITARKQIASFSSTEVLHMQTDENGVYLASDNTIVKIDPESGEQEEIAHTGADILAFKKNKTYTVVADNKGVVSFFGAQATLIEAVNVGADADFICLGEPYAVIGNMNDPVLRVLKLQNRRDTQLFSYDASYIHSEARLNADQTTVMLYGYNGFRLYGMDGRIIAEVELPEADQVYDQIFYKKAGDSRLEVTYYSGMVRSYSAEDGRLISEIMGEPPESLTLQMYTTDRYRIEVPLHGTPKVYDIKTGKQISELKSRDYLAYVTKIDDGLITEYTTAQGERYGLILNDRFETLANLPGLCDISEDGRLLFDDKLGNLRQSRVYSVQELIEIAEQLYG